MAGQHDAASEPPVIPTMQLKPGFPSMACQTACFRLIVRDRLFVGIQVQVELDQGAKVAWLCRPNFNCDVWHRVTLWIRLPNVRGNAHASTEVLGLGIGRQHAYTRSGRTLARPRRRPQSATEKGR
jgi:hypothetical protein